MLNEGEIAPDFSAVDEMGKTHKLSEYRGKTVVLYFYPKDNTPGCTTQACSFRDNAEALLSRKAIVIGVSPDDGKAHKKFKEKFNLDFTLLCDTDHRISSDYGVWGEKSMYGKKYFGINRTTFIIDGNGLIKKIFTKVKPENHAQLILENL